MNLSAPESVYFFTLHKCASSLFGDFVLKHCAGLEHVDYASRIYAGESDVEVHFAERGAVYGPLRLSVNRRSPIFEQVVAPAMARRFIRDKIAVLLVRDPRDILVSAYYSFGFSHGSSANAEIRAQQEEIRERIVQGETVDEFALRSIRAVNRHFERVERIRRACRRCTALRYEDLIDDFDRFAAPLAAALHLSSETIEELHRRSRPWRDEDIRQHHRSGRAGGFRDKLRPETIETLNGALGPVLDQWGYAR